MLCSQLRNLTLAAALTVPTLSLFAGAANASGYDGVLAAQGLTKISCRANVVEIRLTPTQSICAIPTAQYPAGAYYFDERGFTIVPAARMQAPVPQPSTIPTTYPTLPPGFVIPSQGATILDVSNPAQPISPVISSQISAVLSSRGLAPASCSGNPGVTVQVGQYLACAYPTAAFPPGRYVLQ